MKEQLLLLIIKRHLSQNIVVVLSQPM